MWHEQEHITSRDTYSIAPKPNQRTDASSGLIRKSRLTTRQRTCAPANVDALRCALASRCQCSYEQVCTHVCSPPGLLLVWPIPRFALTIPLSSVAPLPSVAIATLPSVAALPSVASRAQLWRWHDPGG